MQNAWWWLWWWKWCMLNGDDCEWWWLWMVMNGHDESWVMNHRWSIIDDEAWMMNHEKIIIMMIVMMVLATMTIMNEGNTWILFDVHHEYLQKAAEWEYPGRILASYAKWIQVLVLYPRILDHQAHTHSPMKNPTSKPDIQILAQATLKISIVIQQYPEAKANQVPSEQPWRLDISSSCFSLLMNGPSSRHYETKCDTAILFFGNWFDLVVCKMAFLPACQPYNLQESTIFLFLVISYLQAGFPSVSVVLLSRSVLIGIGFESNFHAFQWLFTFHQLLKQHFRCGLVGAVGRKNAR